MIIWGRPVCKSKSFISSQPFYLITLYFSNIPISDCINNCQNPLQFKYSIKEEMLFIYTMKTETGIQRRSNGNFYKWFSSRQIKIPNIIISILTIVLLSTIFCSFHLQFAMVYFLVCLIYSLKFLCAFPIRILCKYQYTSLIPSAVLIQKLCILTSTQIKLS